MSRTEEEKIAPTVASRETAPVVVDQDGPLVRLACGGDREAFRRLVERHYRRVYHIARRMLGDPQAAEDIVQETFLAAFKHLPGFEARARFSTWITTIAMNRCRNHLRSAAVSRSAPLSADPPAPASASPEAQAGARELAVHLERALASLSPDQREVILLRDVEGLAYDAIAEALDIEAGTVKSRLHRAREAMRVLLEGVWSP
ncbi:MAG: sigma-70 family RNA polymerase sigma factor [Deltaproteobacteria bacterium]|nr:sigma-70 family RNA polymerase sigma factor [Deltaproteobacteria bacterium]